MQCIRTTILGLAGLCIMLWFTRGAGLISPLDGIMATARQIIALLSSLNQAMKSRFLRSRYRWPRQRRSADAELLPMNCVFLSNKA